MRIFEDLPSDDVFHSCILTTYAFDNNLFDLHIKGVLHSKGITNIIVLCDSSNEFDLFYLKDLDYSLITIHTKGIFHPKIFTFIGKKAIMTHIGSGNLTYGGLGLNHEFFSTVSCESKESIYYPFVAECLSYQQQYIKNRKGSIKKRLGWIIEHCELLDGYKELSNDTLTVNNDETDISLLYNGSTSIYSKLLQIVLPDQVTQIDILSPFWDSSDILIKQLKQDFPSAQINMFLRNKKTSLPLDGTDQVTFLDFDETKIAKENIKRTNHSKLFVFYAKDKNFILHGSANATSAGLGLGAFRNEEASILFQSPKSLQMDFGLAPIVEIPSNEVKSKDRQSNTLSAKRFKSMKYVIIGVDKEFGKLTIYLMKAYQTSADVVFYDADNLEIERLNITLDQELVFDIGQHPELKSAVGVCIASGETILSPIAFITDMLLLRRADPNEANQKKMRLLHKLRQGEANPLDLLEYLNHLMQKNENQEAELKTAVRKVSKNVKEERELTFEEAKRLAEFKESIKQSKFDTNDVLNAMNAYSNMHRSNSFIYDAADYEVEDDDNATQASYVLISSKQKFDRIRESVLRHFNSYISFYQDKIFNYYGNELDEVKSITTMDLIAFLFKYTTLLEASSQKVTVGRTDDQYNDVFVSQTGLIYENNSFSSISIQLIGQFLLFLETFPIEEESDKTRAAELTTLKQDCLTVIVYGLILHMQYDNFYDLDSVTMLYYNTINRLGRLNKQKLDECFNQKKGKFLFAKDKNHCLNTLEENLVKIKGDLDSELSSRKFYESVNLGLCKIYQKLPSANPISLKFSCPGVNYLLSERAYIFPFYYNLKANRWLLPTKKD